MNEKPYVLALILARKGSKGVPGKNIMDIAGQPLISYSIQQAIESEHITRTIVSTDCEKIAEISRQYGAETPFLRPDDLSQDMSPDIDAFQHTIEYLSAHEDKVPDLIVHLRPTGPIRRVSLIDSAIEKILSTPDATSLRSVSLAEQSPYKMWLTDGDLLKPVAKIPGNPEAHSTARQSLPKVYWQNGYVDIVKPHTIMNEKSMVGAKPLAFIVDEKKFELDYPEDVQVIEEALISLKKGDNLEANSDKGDRYPV